MSISPDKVSLIRPHILHKADGVEAFFTLKNEEKMVGKGFIPGLNLGFNTGGSAPVVAENRSRLLSQEGIAPDWIAYADQVHGTRVRAVTEGGTYGETDGLVTQIPDLALAIQVADCAAVLMADPAARVIGAVHAGWRGAAGDILPKAIDLMKELGASTGNMRAFISPCISFKNFEVGPEVAELFPEDFVDYSRYEKPHIDLKGFLEQQLAGAGVERDHIEVHEGCTVEQGDKYYSYRREKERSGRMLGVIRMPV